MGSEKKHRKRRTSPSPSSEDKDDRSRKHSKRDNEERKTRKAGDKERRKRKRDDKSSEKERKGKHKHTKKLTYPGFKELCDEDYYSKNNEFSSWLKEEKGIYFSDLSSEAARALFSSFIKAWNRQKLPPQYYSGIDIAPRTAHNWKIKH